MKKNKKKKNVHNYVDNKRFYDEIVEYKKMCREAEDQGDEYPPIPEYCGKCVYDIANHYSYSPKFVNYSFREEMVSDAIEDCILYFDRFDEFKYTNPLAYYTQICHWAFVGRINEEEKIRYSTYKNFEMTMIMSDDVNLLVDEKNNLIVEPMYDNITEFIERFELKETKKREKKRARLKQKKLDALLEMEDDEGDEDDGNDN